jgi:hypothetical protein
MRNPKIDDRLHALNFAIETLHRLQNDFEPGPTWEIQIRMAIGSVMNEATKLLPEGAVAIPDGLKTGRLI